MQKLLLLSICILASTSFAQVLPLPNSTRLVGTYYGVCLPVGTLCTTERLAIEIKVYSDYTMNLEVVDWDNALIATFDVDEYSPTLFRTTVFRSIPAPLPCIVRGTFSPATGSVSGTLDLRRNGSCLWTFKAYRRFKIN